MTFKLNDVTYTVAENWVELNTTQKMMAVQILTSPTGLDAETDLAFKRVELFKLLTGMVQAGLEIWCSRYVADDPENGEISFFAELEALSTEVTGFFFTPVTENGSMSIALTLLDNPFPQIYLWTDTTGTYLTPFGQRPQPNSDKKIPLKERLRLADIRLKNPTKATDRYVGPGTECEDLDFWELIQLFQSVDKFVKNGDKTHIHRLIALLWRPAPQPPKGEMARISLMEYEDSALKNVDLVAEMPPVIVNLMWFYLCSCHQYYVKSYPSVFEDKEGEINKKLEKYGWSGVLMELAGNDVTKFDDVKRKAAHDVMAQFSYLEDKKG